MMNRFLFGLCTILVFLFASKVSSTKHKKIVFKTAELPIQKLDTVKKDTLKKII